MTGKHDKDEQARGMRSSNHSPIFNILFDETHLARKNDIEGYKG